MPAGSGLVSASFSDPAQAQPLIPTIYQDVTILYLPDKVRFLGKSGAGYTWQKDQGGYSVYNTGGLKPTSWSFSEILAGKGTGFTLNYTLTSAKMPGASLKKTILGGATIDGCDFSNCDLTRASPPTAPRSSPPSRSPSSLTEPN